ncbi:MAG: LamG domain-containing protein [Labilithrix sp.]|nr:LamG domain-containing protein [Labilithrix sp.]
MRRVVASAVAVAVGSLWACSALDLSEYSSGDGPQESMDAGEDGGGSSGSSGSSGGPRDAVAGDADSSDAKASYRDAVMADGPLGYWRLGETAGTNAKDEVGAHAGVYQGGITLGLPGIADDGDTALGLAGTNGSVQLGDSLDFSGNVPITLEAWVWLDALDTDYRRVIAKRGAEGGYSIFCQTNSAGCSLELRGGGGAAITCDVEMEKERWYHVVGTYDGTTARAYRDGVEVCNRIATVTFSKVDAPLVIGAWSTGGNYLEGKLDEVAIYDKALPAARIAEHFAHRKK